MLDKTLVFAATGATLDSFVFVTGEDLPNGALGLVSVSNLIRDLMALDKTFTFVVRRSPREPFTTRFTDIIAADGPLEGVTVATCWIENGAFYYEN